MKALKVILIVLLVLFGLYCIWMATLPSKYEVERSATINAPQEVVYAQISDFKNWENWSPWLAADSTMTFEYGEQTQGQGASYSWTSENMGGGNQQIVRTVGMDTMHTRIAFEGQGESNGKWILTKNEDGSTQVSWSFNGEMGFFQRSFGYLMDAMVGPQFESGLATLKSVAEAKANEKPALKVERDEMTPIQYFGVRDQVSFDEMSVSDFFKERYEMIGRFLGPDMQNMTGAPMAMYYNWDTVTSTTDMIVALPVASTKAGNDTVMPGEFVGGNVLRVDYYGDYSGTGQAHYLIEEYAKENNIKLGAPAVELYVTDPATEPDTNRWLTQVIYPIFSGE